MNRVDDMLVTLLLAATFYKDVLPILQDHCQTCHRPGQIAPMPLVTYAEARPKAKLITEMVRSKKMPPWFADRKVGQFANDASITARHVDTISNWCESGRPAGEPRNAPQPSLRVEGWNLP